jgi:hypothetical protein
MKGPKHDEIVDSLRSRNICEETEKMWSMPDGSLTNCNESVDIILEHISSLVEQFSLTWVRTTSHRSGPNPIGLLLAAARAESNGMLSRTQRGYY